VSDCALKAQLDDWVVQYKTPAYILDDPIQIPYRYVDNAKACECVAWITALFSYGRRSVIIETVNTLFQIMDHDPLGFIEQFSPKRDAKLFQHFVYRFNTGEDVVFLLSRLQWIYKTWGSIEALFSSGLTPHPETGCPDLKTGIGNFLDAVLSGQTMPNRRNGLRFLLAHPKHGGACKRFNMFLRWMVRQDLEPELKVDFGLWRSGISPASLIIPLDTHVLKMNSLLGLTPHKGSTWKTAEALTAVFRAFNPADPVRYDYALFGYSLQQQASRQEDVSCLILA
jgi:uncharacterized protein (TIGR02757 family)